MTISFDDRAAQGGALRVYRIVVEAVWRIAGRDGRSRGAWEPDSGIWATAAPFRVTDMEIDEVVVAEAVSLADAIATPNRWWWDDSGRLYLNVADPFGGNPDIVAMVAMYISSAPKEDAEGVPYEPVVFDAPRLTTGVTEELANVRERGGGTLSIANGDGLYDIARDMTLIRAYVDLGLDSP